MSGQQIKDNTLYPAATEQRMVLACPACGSISWRQEQDYSATDRHYLDWNPEAGRYEFTYEVKATSDENTGPWECSNGHRATDELDEQLAAALS